MFEQKPVLALLGNLAFTDDVLVKHLKDFDYGLTNPSFNPGHADANVDTYTNGGDVIGSEPRAIYAWAAAFNMYFRLPEDNMVTGPGGVGRYITFPFFQELSVDQYKTGWISWHKMLQGDSVDDIRKLILFADVVRGAAPNSPIIDTRKTQSARDVAANAEGTGYAKKKRRFPADDAKAVARATWPGMMSLFVGQSIAPPDLRAVNLPTLWDVSVKDPRDPYSTISGSMGNPGLTAGEWFGAVLSSGGATVNDNKDFQAFTTAIFNGNVAAAKAVVNQAVSNKALVAQVQASKAELQNADLPDDLKPRLAQAIAVNPMGIYRHLGEAVTRIFPGGGI